jgi:hypothetical protein
MQLLIYAASFNPIARDLRKRIQSIGPETWTGTTFCTSLMALDKQLRKPLGPSSIGIMIPSDDDELADLIGMRHLLRDMRVILILPPGARPDMGHTLAHMLRPRFITRTDENLDEVTAVLRKMMDAACAAAL